MCFMYPEVPERQEKGKNWNRGQMISWKAREDARNSKKPKQEVILSDNIKMLDLSLGVDSWKDEILNTKLQRNNKSIEQIEEKGYSVVSEAKKLTDLYRNFN